LENQLNELTKGEKTSNSQNKYNLRWKKREFIKPDIPDQPTKAEHHAEEVENNNKGKKAHNPPPVVKGPILELREIIMAPSSFKFEHEMKKI
jgi:hypothetical protein